MADPALPPEQPRERQAGRRPGWRAVAAIAAAGLVAVAFGVWRGRSGDELEVAQEQALPVAAVAVEPVSSYEVTRSYTGEIAALRASELGFERGGTVTEILVGEGDRVAEGQPLARLDVRNLQAQREQLLAQKARAAAELAELEAGPRSEDIAAARANVRDLQEQLNLQAAQRERRRYLYEEGAIAREELDEFAFGAEALQARLVRARSELEELENGTRPEDIAAQRATVRQLAAQIDSVEVDLSKSTIAAPFAGIVATRAVDEGAVASAGQSMLRIVEAALPEARIGLPTRSVQQLAVGDRQTVQIANGEYTARVTAILPEVDPETRTQVVVFELPNLSISEVSPGQTVRVQYAEAIPAEGYWIPSTALAKGVRGLWTTYTIASPPDAAATDRYTIAQESVEILHQDDNRVLVRGTLEPGDRVVSDGTHRLVPGQIVRPVEAEPESSAGAIGTES